MKRVHHRMMMLIAATLVTLAAVSGAAQAPAAAAAPFVGNWTLGLDTPQGAMSMDLTVKNDGGKLAGSIMAAMIMVAPQPVSEIAVNGKNLVLQYAFDYQGQAVPAAITIMPDGDKWKASFDFAGGQFVVDGTADKK